MTADLPAHVPARIAEHVSVEMGVDVGADDVEFIVCYVNKIDVTPTERRRFFTYNTFVRQAVVEEARQYTQNQ